ncbi:hypothetical protein [Citrobacter sp. CK195]|uniref:hypothetical protein n=1 Tax=Citrobacter sp. CK195 TaxID=2985104 RepID=UPI002576E20F|nr:hypothetical protein [Citrobacter sp. CK195]MDM2993398.1 hypothetical protein [Citrobacter sp. CK195]
MSNIDKQALRQTAEKAKDNFMPNFMVPTRDLLALLDELEALQSFRTAYMEWSDKTDWVQTDKRLDVIKPWGKHRADVLKLYIDHLESKLEAAEKRGDKISLDYDTLADEANIIAEQRDELIIRNHEIAELLINLKKARPGGVYFNKWDTQIDSVLRAAGIGKGA